MVDRSLNKNRFDISSAPLYAAHGTALQMSRMLPKPTGRSKSAYFDPSSDEEEEETTSHSEFAQAQTSVQQNVHTLASIMALQQSIQKAEAEKPRVPEREIRSMPTNNFGVDPNLFKMIYNLGYDAGLDKRDPIPPCRVCEERRRKNRIAAAEQRKRQRDDAN
jgi:hypothetical protein